MTSPYREYAPCPALRACVDCYWALHEGPHASPPPQRILPDGSVDIVLRAPAFPTAPWDGMIVSGAMSRPHVHVPSEPSRYLGVRFQPGWAGFLLGFPAHECTDGHVPLVELWQPGPWQDALMNVPDDEAAIAALERELLKRLARADPPARHVAVAIARIRAASGALPIAELADELGLTRQHLTRSFQAHVGLPPKTFARVVRIRSVLKGIGEAREVDWADLALSAGFHDQSHLVAEFKDLVGLTPTRWLAER